MASGTLPIFLHSIFSIKSDKSLNLSIFKDRPSLSPSFSYTIMYTVKCINTLNPKLLVSAPMSICSDSLLHCIILCLIPPNQFPGIFSYVFYNAFVGLSTFSWFRLCTHSSGACWHRHHHQPSMIPSLVIRIKNLFFELRNTRISWTESTALSEVWVSAWWG